MLDVCIVPNTLQPLPGPLVFPYIGMASVIGMVVGGMKGLQKSLECGPGLERVLNVGTTEFMRLRWAWKLVHNLLLLL